MILHEILRHIADNMEAGRDQAYGLLVDGRPSNLNLNGSEGYLFMAHEEKYTLAPRTHTVNGFIVPSPMGVKPSRGERYSIIDFTEADLLQVLPWRDDPADNRSFKRGLCFTTRLDVQQNALAMLGRDPSKGVDGV